MPKLVILIAGKKGSGKNTLANQIAAWWFNHHSNPSEVQFTVCNKGLLWNCLPGTAVRKQVDIGPGGVDGPAYLRDGVEILSFATPLKNFCTDVLGLEHNSCWGTDADKNRSTHLRWEGLPANIRRKYALGRKWYKPWTWNRKRCGFMTGREVMQVFGTDLIREWYGDAWAKGCMQAAMRSPAQVVIVPDCRFPNELRAGCELQASHHEQGVRVRTVRLRRCPYSDLHPSERALDNVTDHAFTYVLSPAVTVDMQRQFVEKVMPDMTMTLSFVQAA